MSEIPQKTESGIHFCHAWREWSEKQAFEGSPILSQLPFFLFQIRVTVAQQKRCSSKEKRKRPYFQLEKSMKSKKHFWWEVWVETRLERLEVEARLESDSLSKTIRTMTWRRSLLGWRDTMASFEEESVAIKRSDSQNDPTQVRFLRLGEMVSYNPNPLEKKRERETKLDL